MNLGMQVVEVVLYNEYFGLSWRGRFHFKTPGVIFFCLFLQDIKLVNSSAIKIYE